MTVRARIVSTTPGAICTIRLEPDAPYEFQAGQYLSVQHPDGTEIPLSIASAPGALPELVLRFQPTAGDFFSAQLQSLLANSHLNITAAQGEVTSKPYDVPLLIIAGGSGIAQAFSCAADRHNAAAAAPTRILWCTDHQTDAPDATGFDAFDNTELILLVDRSRTADNKGVQWVSTHAENIAHMRIILAGSPSFVYLMHDLLIEQGVGADSVSSDVFAYAPR